MHFRNKEYRKNKCVEIKDIYGYDNYYFVKGGKHLSAQDEEFEVSEDASRGQLAAAFKKHAKSKKTNKVLMSKFGVSKNFWIFVKIWQKWP